MSLNRHSFSLKINTTQQRVTENKKDDENEESSDFGDDYVCFSANSKY